MQYVCKYLDYKKHMLQDNSCVPLLVLANKQDLPHAASPTQVKTGVAKRPLQITLSVLPTICPYVCMSVCMYVCMTNMTYRRSGNCYL